MDVEPHHVNCPIYTENALKRRSSPSSSPDDVEDIAHKAPSRKSRRSGKKSPSGDQEDESKFCALCEVEQHLARVHKNATNREKPVAPSVFVHGFIDRVAPWFKLGQQEDSHEFLRLLIDAMQRSCKRARTSQENQDTPPEKMYDDMDTKSKDMEYPFRLFSGTVESNVTCEYCKSSSSTLDPIEDIGLDVTPMASSSSSSPPPGFLADVGSALQRFARAEALDASYKCDKCGNVGRATKQSRLASIPPILTLHLKRFRYGETQNSASASNGHSTRRSHRSSEVSQLLSSNSGDFFAGKSGSAKIEGHSKFEQILDLKPYLTEELQAKHSNMFCRLFAVIVHAGKNSHSGHYISYVRNIAKNEWWKMDDARVTVAPISEVMNAEAYMLFYRVVEHPVAVELRSQAKKLEDDFMKETAKELKATSKADTSGEADKRTGTDTSKQNIRSTKGAKQEANSRNGSPVKNNPRKRKSPEFTSGDDWARAKTSLPEYLVSQFKDIELHISEFVQFKPEFFKLLTEQASKGNAKVGHGPSSGICEDDIVGGTSKIKRALLHVLFQLQKQRGNSSFLFKRLYQGSATIEKEKPVGVVSNMVDPDE